MNRKILVTKQNSPLFSLVALIAWGALGSPLFDSSAAGQQRAAWTTSRITGTPTPPPRFALRQAFPNRRFEKPTSLTELPDGRLLITEIGGKLFTFPKADTASSQSDLLLEIQGATVWHATPHPQFEQNGRLFVCYSREGVTYVSEFHVSGTPPKAQASDENVIITWPAGGHNAGCLTFATDGMLLVSTGDGSGPNPPDGRTAAQDVSNLFGCILRLDVDSSDGEKNYAIPKDNPFVETENARGEIWAYGLRNPWKFGVDRASGNIFAADNGWESWEMVHQIVRGGNCGWPIMEGRAVLRSEVERGPTPIRPPVKDHSHTEANSVVGGPIYRGSKLDLDGTFVYGDYITGTIWGLNTEDGSYSHQTLVDTDQRIVAFAQGSNEELYVLDYDLTGQIYELVPSGLEDRSAAFPRKLSETGLFTSLKDLSPAAGVTAYGVTVERWLDGYQSQRFVAIPAKGAITLAADEKAASYPEGTVLVKHVVLPADGTKGTPAETQLLHFENGVWHPYTYAWTNSLSGEPLDALLVDFAGADQQVVTGAGDDGVHLGPVRHFSAENECRLCHNAGSGFVLGFSPNQLNVTDQLARLVSEKTISSHPRLTTDNPGRLVDPHDTKQSLDDRARSYLHGNCSSCHHTRGNAIVSFYLRRDMPFDELKTNKGTGIGTFGMQDAKLIVPGDPYRSVLLYRMSKLGYGRMPYIGSRAVDSRGIALIEEWIRAMPLAVDSPSAPVSPRSRETRALKRAAELKQPLRNKRLVDVLLGSTEGALALSSAIHAGKVADDGAQAVYESTPGDIRGLFEDFVAASARRKTLGPNADPQTVLALDGDALRGKLIFFSDGARCRNCHHQSDVKLSTGPTLDAIRKKYKKRDEILQHIVKPSLKVDDEFAMWVVARTDGQVLRGLILSKSDDAIMLKTAERKEVLVARSDIDEMTKSTQSLMPSGILSDLTAQEAADLLEWLGQF
jgi:putative heme-binding domain-containing protein